MEEHLDALETSSRVTNGRIERLSRLGKIAEADKYLLKITAPDGLNLEAVVSVIDGAVINPSMPEEIPSFLTRLEGQEVYFSLKRCEAK